MELGRKRTLIQAIGKLEEIEWNMGALSFVEKNQRKDEGYLHPRALKDNLDGIQNVCKMLKKEIEKLLGDVSLSFCISSCILHQSQSYEDVLEYPIGNAEELEYAPFVLDNYFDNKNLVDIPGVYFCNLDGPAGRYALIGFRDTYRRPPPLFKCDTEWVVDLKNGIDYPDQIPGSAYVHAKQVVQIIRDQNISCIEINAVGYESKSHFYYE